MTRKTHGVQLIVKIYKTHKTHSVQLIVKIYKTHWSSTHCTDTITQDTLVFNSLLECQFHRHWCSDQEKWLIARQNQHACPSCSFETTLPSSPKSRSIKDNGVLSKLTNSTNNFLERQEVSWCGQKVAVKPTSCRHASTMYMYMQIYMLAAQAADHDTMHVNTEGVSRAQLQHV